MERVELTPSGVLFREDTHQYFRENDGKELMGITGVLSRQLFPNEYDSIPEYMRDRILASSAEYGISVHKSCEDFDTNWINDGTIEVRDYISICQRYGLIHEASEFTITDGEHYASQIDKVYRVNDNTFSLGDIKTYCGKLRGEKLEKVRWQLSIYAYLLQLQCPNINIDKLYVMHIRNKQKKDGRYDHISEVITVDRIPSECCKELLDCNLRGEQYIPSVA